MRRPNIVIAITTALATFYGCSADKDCLMKIGQQKLTYSQAVDRFKQAQIALKKQKVTEEDAKSFCEKAYARDMLYLEEAKNLGIEKEDSVQARFQEYRQRLLVYDGGPLLSRVTASLKIPNEEQLQQFYDRRKVEYKIAQILLPSKPLADSLYQEIKSGANFEQLVRRFSCDRRWGDDEGVWHDWFLYGSMGGDFDDLVISLRPGEVAPPIHTRYGYHVIKVIDKRNHAQLPFAKERAWLLNACSSMESARAVFQYKQGILVEYKPQINLLAAQWVSQAYRESEERTPILEAGNFSPAQLDAPLLTFQDQSLTIKEFLHYYQSQRAIFRPPLRRLDAIEECAKQAVMEDLLYLEAIKLGLNRNPDFQNRLRQYQRNLVLSECRKRLAQPFVITDEELKARYDADSTFHIQPFDQAAKWVRRAVNTEKQKAEQERQLAYLKGKYPIKFCREGVRRLVAAVNEAKATPTAAK